MNLVDKALEQPVAVIADKFYLNESERIVFLKEARRIKFADRMPNCKNIDRPECYSGYETRFNNWKNKLIVALDSERMYNSSKRILA